MKKMMIDVVLLVMMLALAIAAFWSIEVCDECVTIAFGLLAWKCGAKLKMRADEDSKDKNTD